MVEEQNPIEILAECAVAAVAKRQMSNDSESYWPATATVQHKAPDFTATGALPYCPSYWPHSSTLQLWLATSSRRSSCRTTRASGPCSSSGRSTSPSSARYACFFAIHAADRLLFLQTEILAFSDRAKEFKAIGAELIGCSIDSKVGIAFDRLLCSVCVVQFVHLAWTKSPRKAGGLGGKVNFPVIADVSKRIAADYGVLVDKGADEGIALRGLFIIDPQGIVRQITINDLPVGRSVRSSLCLCHLLASCSVSRLSALGSVRSCRWTRRCACCRPSSTLRSTARSVLVVLVALCMCSVCPSRPSGSLAGCCCSACAGVPR